MQRSSSSYPFWVIVVVTVLIIGVIVASAYFFVKLSNSSAAYSNTSSSISSSNTSSLLISSSSSVSSTVSSIQSLSDGRVLRISESCIASVTYDPNIFTFEEVSNYRNYFGSNTQGFRLTSGSNQELLVECGQITDDENSNMLLESLQQTWFNSAMNYTLYVLDANYQIDGRSAVKLNINYDDNNGYHSETAYIVAVPEKIRGYVIRVIDDVYGSDSFASQILSSVKLGVGV